MNKKLIKVHLTEIQMFKVCCPSNKPFKKDKQDMLGNDGEVGPYNLKVMFFYRLIHMNAPVLADIHQLSEYTGYSLEGLATALDNKVEW